MIRLLLALLLSLPTVCSAQIAAWGTDPATVETYELKRVPEAQRLTITPGANGLVKVHYLSRFLKYPAWIVYGFTAEKLTAVDVVYRLSTQKTTPAPPGPVTAELTELFGPARTVSPTQRYWSTPKSLILQSWSDSTHTIRFEKR